MAFFDCFKHPPITSQQVMLQKQTKSSSNQRNECRGVKTIDDVDLYRMIACKYQVVYTIGLLPWP